MCCPHRTAILLHGEQVGGGTKEKPTQWACSTLVLKTDIQRLNNAAQGLAVRGLFWFSFFWFFLVFFGLQGQHPLEP